MLLLLFLAVLACIGIGKQNELLVKVRDIWSLLRVADKITARDLC